MFQGQLIDGISGEFRGGRLVRLDAKRKADRDFLADFLFAIKDADRLGEVALVDSSSRIGKAGRIYYNTLLDENAAAHIAFGSGFAHTRADHETSPRRARRQPLGGARRRDDRHGRLRGDRHRRPRPPRPAHRRRRLADLAGRLGDLTVSRPYTRLTGRRYR